MREKREEGQRSAAALRRKSHSPVANATAATINRVTKLRHSDLFFALSTAAVQ